MFSEIFSGRNYCDEPIVVQKTFKSVASNTEHSNSYRHSLENALAFVSVLMKESVLLKTTIQKKAEAGGVVCTREAFL